MAINGHQWSSVVISDHQWSSVVISGHQWSSAHLLHLMQPCMLCLEWLDRKDLWGRGMGAVMSACMLRRERLEQSVTQSSTQWLTIRS